MSFTQSVYHIVFSTKWRKPIITNDKEREVYKILYNLMNSYGCHTYRIGGMPDHIHILVDISSKLSLSSFMKQLKQESSFIISQNRLFPNWDGWEEGYAAFSYSAKEIPVVVNYITNQKEHHKKISFIDEYKNWLIEMGVSPDVPYFPK